MAFAIKSGIPIPDGLMKNKYPFDEMSVGDMFFVQYKNDDGVYEVPTAEQISTLRKRVSSAASMAKGRGMGTFGTQIMMEDGKYGIAVWKLSEHGGE